MNACLHGGARTRTARVLSYWESGLPSPPPPLFARIFCGVSSFKKFFNDAQYVKEFKLEDDKGHVLQRAKPMPCTMAQLKGSFKGKEVAGKSFSVDARLSPFRTYSFVPVFVGHRNIVFEKHQGDARQEKKINVPPLSPTQFVPSQGKQMSRKMYDSLAQAEPLPAFECRKDSIIFDLNTLFGADWSSNFTDESVVSFRVKDANNKPEAKWKVLTVGALRKIKVKDTLDPWQRASVSVRKSDPESEEYMTELEQGESTVKLGLKPSDKVGSLHCSAKLVCGAPRPPPFLGG